MSVDAGMLEPNLIRHLDRRDGERSRLQELESAGVERPFDLDRTADHRRRLHQHAAEGDGLPGVETGGRDKLARHRLRDGAAQMCAAFRMILAARLDAAQKSLAREHDAVRHDLTLRDGGAEPPGRADQHVPVGGLAQAAARCARIDKRLDQHRHGRVRGGEAVALHPAPRGAGPQRRPTGAHGCQEGGLVVDAKEAFELAGEVCALGILDQRGGPHRAGTCVLRALRAPGREQRRADVGGNRLLIEREPDLHGEAALRDGVGSRESAEHALEPQRRDLRAIGVRAEAEAARRRQTSAHELRQVGRFRTDPRGIVAALGVKRNDELIGHFT